MIIRPQFIFNLVTLTILSLATSAIYNNSATAQNEISEVEAFCLESPQDSICSDRESYISLEKWQENKTKCSLATEWNNEAKKCKVVADNNQLTVYVEDGLVSESLPNTLKTKAITIALDNMFAFDAQWWLADVEISNIGGDVGYGSLGYKSENNAVGTFPEIRIAFVSQSDSLPNVDAKFLTISGNRLHQDLEQMEAWRYYLPDTIEFEQRLQSSISNQNSSQNITANVKQLKRTGECPDCDLSNADLSELDLTNANLQRANLTGANLTKTKLKNAYLFGSNLTKANLVAADLETANLMFAILNKADLFEAKLKGANLQNANLQNADLTDAELKAKDLQVTSLKNANLDNAILIDADLRCVNFQSASLKNADLQGANLSQCKKSEAGSFGRLSRLKLNGVTVSFSTLDDVNNILSIVTDIIGLINNPLYEGSRGVKASKIKFSLESNLNSANLSGANLTGANLSEANLTDINLSNVLLADAKLSKNNLSNANFINTDVSEVDFKDPELICEAIFSDESIYEEYCQEEE